VNGNDELRAIRHIDGLTAHFTDSDGATGQARAAVTPSATIIDGLTNLRS
jgi:hypothetical protein